MGYKRVNHFALMKVGKTKNTFVVSGKSVIDAIKKKSFDNAPIVFNENENFKDYRNNNDVAEFCKEKCIGSVIPDTVTFDEEMVYGDVMLSDDFSSKTAFDNWCVDYDKDNDKFTYISCELFNK